MRRIKVLLIEEIILIVYLIIFGLNFHLEERPDGFMYDVILVFSSLAILGNVIEAIVDQTISRSIRKGKNVRKIIRYLLCFFLLIGAFYSVFYLRFLFDINSVTSIMFLLLSSCGSFVHLIISHIIYKVVNHKPDSLNDESVKRNDDCLEYEDESYE